jgi:MFS family permease
MSMALGPLLGGGLTQAIGWRAIFWINVPIGIAAVILAAIYVPESKAARARAFDPVGQVLVFIGLTALTYSVIEGPRAGWASLEIRGLFLVAALALIAFLFYEPRRTDPLVNLRYFRSVPFSSSIILGFSSFSSFSAFLFLNTLYLQQVRGLPAFRTGFMVLPLAVVMMVTSPWSGRLIGKYGTRPSLYLAGSGFLLSTLLLTQLSPTTPLPLLMLAYALFGLGLGVVNPAISNNAVAGMPLSQAGVAAAIASTSRQVGAALGIAIAGTVVNVSRAQGLGFTPATHPIWWVMTGCGIITLFLGWASATGWSRNSAELSAADLSTAN